MKGQQLRNTLTVATCECSFIEKSCERTGFVICMVNLTVSETLFKAAKESFEQP